MTVQCSHIRYAWRRRRRGQGASKEDSPCWRLAPCPCVQLASSFTLRLRRETQRAQRLRADDVWQPVPAVHARRRQRPPAGLATQLQRHVFTHRHQGMGIATPDGDALAAQLAPWSAAQTTTHSWKGYGGVGSTAPSHAVQGALISNRGNTTVGSWDIYYNKMWHFPWSMENQFFFSSGRWRFIRVQS
jgi:hypothetical protein